MLPKEVIHIGDGLIEARPGFLQKILVSDADIEQHYDVEVKPFARGNFGTVRRATHKETGIKYAAKFLRRRRRAACWAKQIQHEIAVLMLSADSEQIVKLHAVYETRSEFVLILEMAAGGELQNKIDEDGSLSEQKTRMCVREVLKALEYLHRRNVAHLDLKPQNILLNTNNLEDGLKLCDFGFSRAIEGNSNVCEIQGTPDYVAPEIVQYEPLSLNTDIWSVGVLAYVLLTGYSPFGSDDKQETFLNISKCHLTFPDDLFQEVSDDAIDFIKSTLRLKPCDRLDVFECLNHKWLKLETPQQQLPAPSPQILTVQTSNVTIVKNGTEESVNAIKCTTIVTQLNADNINDDDDDDYVVHADTERVNSKNDENKLTNGKYICVDKEDKENSRTIHEHQDTTTSLAMAIIPFHNGTTPANATKLVLEKSSSISLFPDAPTTPKVCRKMIYEDEAELKEIVKKYQTNATAACCDDESSVVVSDCLVCHPNLSASNTTSLKLDKGITSC